MKQNFGKLSIFILSGIILIYAPLSVQALNDNLYVSRDTMLQNLNQKYDSIIEKIPKSEGCNSSFPSGWKHQSNLRYIDRISPSFSLGFYKKDFPIVIDSTTFSKTQFTNSSHTAILEVGNPIKLKMLIFEDTGPHNIENVTIATNFKDGDLAEGTNTVKVIFEKVHRPPPIDSIYLYAYGGIEEDQERSYTYPNKLGNYFTKISDPVGLFSDVKGSATKINHKMEIIFEITFTKPMKKSDLVIIASDVNNNTMICKIVDAWQAVNSAENYQESNSQTERTILKLHDFRDFRFDGGQPIVFVGKLTSETGERMPSAKILIKSDAPCPKDGILASDFTDKYGKFWIYTITKTWNESDNVIKVHAEFEGNEKFEASISDEKSIVIYPSHGERCVN